MTPKKPVVPLSPRVWKPNFNCTRLSCFFFVFLIDVASFLNVVVQGVVGIFEDLHHVFFILVNTKHSFVLSFKYFKEKTKLNS